jgi:hypothetical protein
MLTVLFPFDGNLNDLTGYATGTFFGSGSIGYSTGCYVGSQAASLTSTSSQYVQIPYVNLAQRSFTIETWVYMQSSGSQVDYGIFSQCDSNSRCLSVSVRNARIIFSLDALNANNVTLTGALFISSANIWVHVAVVYDAVLSQQRIYVNGRIDTISRGIVASFQGSSSGALTAIGRTISQPYGTTYFNGYVFSSFIRVAVMKVVE